MTAFERASELFDILDNGNFSYEEKNELLLEITKLTRQHVRECAERQRKLNEQALNPTEN